MDVPLHKYWGDMSPCPIGLRVQNSLKSDDVVGKAKKL